MDKSIKLRALEPTDLDLIYRWENDNRVWFSSSTTRPLSKQTLQWYIDSVNDVYTDKQLRMIIVNKYEPVGCVDLFDFDPLNQRMGVGIMIDANFEGMGFAQLAIQEVKKYAFTQLGVHQLFCQIAASNSRSIALFEKVGFLHTATKKDWLRIENQWIDELFFQCFNS
ncbi:MAG: diamine N-acetyltransferase [Salibacteraceae bacterium]|jgi:diamine N-acetyltransferase